MFKKVQSIALVAALIISLFSGMTYAEDTLPQEQTGEQTVEAAPEAEAVKEEETVLPEAETPEAAQPAEEAAGEQSGEQPEMPMMMSSAAPLLAAGRHKNTSIHVYGIPEGASAVSVTVKGTAQAAQKQGGKWTLSDAGEFVTDDITLVTITWANGTSTGVTEFTLGTEGGGTVKVTVSGVSEPVTTYQLSYDANGGSGSMAAVTANAGSNVTVADNGFTAPDGKQFAGWNTKADNSGTAYAAGSTLALNGNVTLYAQWKAAPVTDDTWPVRFYLEGLSGSNHNYLFTDTWGALASYLSGGFANIGSAAGTAGMLSAKITGDSAVKSWLAANGIAAPVDMSNVAATLQSLIDKGYITANTVVTGGYTAAQVIAAPAAFEIVFTQATKNYDGLQAYYAGNHPVVSDANFPGGWQNSYHVHLTVRVKSGMYAVTYRDSMNTATVYESAAYAPASRVTLTSNVPVKTGYTFTGWFKTAACTTAASSFYIMRNTDIYAGWRINSYAYTVNYYKDSIAAANLLGSETGSAAFGSTIPYTNGNYLPAGYAAPGAVSGRTTVTADAAANVLNIVYAKDSFGYTVNYFVDGVQDATMTVTDSAEFASVVSYGTAAAPDKCPEGYELESAVADLTIGAAAADNVMNVYYVKADFGYTVNYFVDGVQDAAMTVTDSAEFASVVSYGTAAAPDKCPEGYELESAVADLTIGAAADGNVMNVYSVKADFGFTVNYFKDSIADGNLLGSETGTAVFGSDIPYTNGNYLPEGYAAPGAVSGQTTITADAAANVLNIVYAKGSFGYTVNYFKDSIADGNLLGSETGTAVFGSDIPFTNGNYLPEGYAAPGAVSGQATVTADAAANVLNIVYAKDSFAYTIEYYYNGSRNDALTEHGSAEFGSKITVYPEKSGGYVFSRVEGIPMTVSAIAEQNVIRVYYVSAPVPVSYTVTYLTYNGNVVSTGSYGLGGVVSVPAGPARANYNFLGWALESGSALGAGNIVTGNAVYRAAYAPAEPVTTRYTVRFEDYDGTLISETTYALGDTAAYPADPSRDGYTFSDWTLYGGIALGGGNIVRGDVIYRAAYTKAGDLVEITDNGTPLASSPAWALLNLILTVGTGLTSIALLVNYFGKREDEDKRKSTRRKGGLRLSSLIPAVGAVIAFILTENMRNPMVFTDKWTLLMVAIAAVQAVVAVLCKKGEDKNDSKTTPVKA
ncbi:MAG: InlB B-repeat-containing protein [Oscillospiraceae bacterium]|nr:InlB B-repeat-containing protein [Oscillospiraceae bacterium]